jgi:hypothetical protein
MRRKTVKGQAADEPSLLVVYMVREKPEPSPINAAVKGRHWARNSEK